MACDKPLRMFQAPNVGPSFKDDIDFETGEVQRRRGTRSLSFTPSEGSASVTVPCGRCAGCLLAQSRVLAIRAYHESTRHRQNSFLTLTYDDDHLPEDGKVSVETMQKFWKRLRFRKEVPKIRYLCCGEYGDLGGRPHYHALVFGADFMDGRARLWKEDQFLHPLLQDVWGLGMVTHAPLNFARCAYVAGYVTKKIGTPDVFRKMSTGRGANCGLGHGWLTAHASSIRNVGGVVIEGQVLPVPSYYFDKADLSDVKSESRARVIAQENRLVDSGLYSVKKNAKAVNNAERLKRKRGVL